jgi:uracil-DNA glycosylase
MCPGKQRRRDRNHEVFHGNRTGDLVEEVVGDYGNVFLTNVFNYWTHGKIKKEIILLGMKELKEDIKFFEPQKIICLGNFAFDKVCSIEGLKMTIIKLPHPSYILRFNKDIENYKERLKEAIRGL